MLVPPVRLSQIQVVASKLVDDNMLPHGDQLTCVSGEECQRVSEGERKPLMQYQGNFITVDLKAVLKTTKISYHISLAR